MDALINIWISLVLLVAGAQQPAAPGGMIEKGNFRFAYDERGVSGLGNPHDPLGATLVPAASSAGGRGGRGGGAALGLTLAYRVGAGEWVNVPRGQKLSTAPEGGVLAYTSNSAGSPLKV